MSRRFQKIRDRQPVVSIESLDAEGVGLGMHAGRATRVHGALPGEQARVRYIGTSRCADEAVGEDIHNPSPERAVPPCEFAAICSGCALQHARVEAQIAFREKRLSEHLAAAGCELESLWPALTDTALGYRRRGRLSVRFVRGKGRALVGFREKNGRFVAELDQCLVMVPVLGSRLAELSDLVSSLDAKEDIPQIEFAAGDQEAALVFRHIGPLKDGDLAALSAFGRETGLRVLLQAGGPDSLVCLEPEAPEPLFYDLPEQSVRLRFQPLDFIQVHAGINRRLVKRVLELLEPVARGRWLDLFCGLGNFTLPLARAGAEITGVEGSASLVDRARHNAVLNGIENVSFLVSDLIGPVAEKDWAAGKYDAVLMDPPRAGLGVSAETVIRLDAECLIYVSCNARTLASDARVITDSGAYGLTAAGVVDMFPHTSHGEAIALFEAR